jgi:hypothetical protein
VAALAIAGTAVVLAATARFTLVESPAMAAACDAEPWQSGCGLRTLVIRSFVEQRIGWGALVVAVAATLMRRRDLAGLALAAGGAGAVLYAAGPSVPAALLGLLVFARPSPGVPAGDGSPGSRAGQATAPASASSSAEKPSA